MSASAWRIAFIILIPVASAAIVIIAAVAAENATETDPALPEPLNEAVIGWQTEWSERSIELDELVIGINDFELRTRIRPIDAPAFVDAATGAAENTAEEPGMLVEVGDDARFYPLRIMAVHEIVNDELDGRPIAVTYSPLVDWAAAYDRVVDRRELRFRASGLLRASGSVMWDDITESLWQQQTGEAVVGSLTGTVLEPVPTVVTSWAEFAAAHPDGRVLAQDQDLDVDYGFNPYPGYTARSRPIGGFFDGWGLDDRRPAMERVVGVEVGGATGTYPYGVIESAQVVEDEVGGVPVVVLWSPGTLDSLDAETVAEGAAVGSAAAFDRRVDGTMLTFTARGDEFVDAQTGSTWTALGQAVEGPLAGTRLEPVVQATPFWFSWSALRDAQLDEPVG